MDEKNETSNFKRIDKIMLPKDYIKYRLSGNFCTDVSDASGTLLFDVENRSWNKYMIDMCGISEKNLPKVYESCEVIGKIRKEYSDLLGLKENFLIISGSGDNEAAAVGMGVVKEGKCNLSIGTSGTIFVPIDKFKSDGIGSIHTFCNVDGNYHLLSCMLNAGSCNKWWVEDVLKSHEFNDDISNLVNVSKNEVIFLPYLSGERSPINDPFAKGCFLGLSLSTDRNKFLQSVFEGVAFGLYDSFQKICELEVNIDKITACGGGIKNMFWMNVIASVFNREIYLSENQECASYGASILCIVGCGLYSDLNSAVNDFVKLNNYVEPIRSMSDFYFRKYQLFKESYLKLKDIFKEIERLKHG